MRLVFACMLVPCVASAEPPDVPAYCLGVMASRMDRAAHMVPVDISHAEPVVFSYLGERITYFSARLDTHKTAAFAFDYKSGMEAESVCVDGNTSNLCTSLHDSCDRPL